MLPSLCLLFRAQPSSFSCFHSTTLFFPLPLGSFSFSFPSSFHGGLVLLVLELMTLCCLFSLFFLQGLRAVILSVFVLCRACCLTFSARAFVVLPSLYFVCFPFFVMDCCFYLPFFCPLTCWFHLALPVPYSSIHC